MFNKYALCFRGTPFLPGKNPRRARRRVSTRGWSYPITFRSLVVKHTAWTQNWKKHNSDTFHQFSKTQVAPKMTISMIWSCRSVLPPQNFDAQLFHVQKKHRFSWILMIFTILWFWAQGPWGPWGPSFFDIFWKCVLWSGIYLEVFLGCLGVQGTP